MQKTLLRLLFAAVVVVVVTLAVNPPGEFAPLRELGLEKIELPDEWLCTWCEEEQIVSPDWVYTEAEDWVYQKFDRYASSDNPRDTMFIGVWEDIDTGEIIEIIIADYKHPILADLKFFLTDPVKIYWKSNANFVYAKEDIVPSDWSFTNNEADEEAVRCGGGDEARCGGWYYHARYRQYYLLVHLRGISDSGTFERIVEATTSHFSEEIIR